MSITVNQVEGYENVAVLGIQGDLDASNYQDVINQAQAAYQGGAQYLLIDMSELRFMASSGLVSLHSIALLMQGEQPPNPEHGWEAFHSISRESEGGKQDQVKLLQPQPRVMQTLKKTGFSELFEIYDDRDSALASFGD